MKWQNETRSTYPTMFRHVLESMYLSRMVCHLTNSVYAFVICARIIQSWINMNNFFFLKGFCVFLPFFSPCFLSHHPRMTSAPASALGCSPTRRRRCSTTMSVRPIRSSRASGNAPSWASPSVGEEGLHTGMNHDRTISDDMCLSVCLFVVLFCLFLFLFVWFVYLPILL